MRQIPAWQTSEGRTIDRCTITMNKRNWHWISLATSLTLSSGKLTRLKHVLLCGTAGPADCNQYNKLPKWTQETSGKLLRLKGQWTFQGDMVIDTTLCLTLISPCRILVNKRMYHYYAGTLFTQIHITSFNKKNPFFQNICVTQYRKEVTQTELTYISLE